MGVALNTPAVVSCKNVEAGLPRGYVLTIVTIMSVVSRSDRAGPRAVVPLRQVLLIDVVLELIPAASRIDALLLGGPPGAWRATHIAWR